MLCRSGFREVLEAKIRIASKGTHRIEEVHNILIGDAFTTFKLLELRHFVL